ncbi:MAG: hypothetical protein K1000chlam2_01532 [Chlamydiae bacterium]|nr:hypothetical protein [Chlamydiota bacterium]
MRLILLLLLFLPSIGFSKVYDCFPFYNELELLQIRLDELDPVVDYFVLVESIETQRGHPKELCFEQNKELFARYLPKIIHVVVEETHPEFTLWERENYQRNCIMKGLENCAPNDFVLISDVDEIPRAPLIPFAEKKMNGSEFFAIGFEMTMYRFQLNRINPQDARWAGTVGTTYRNLLKKKPQFFRDRRSKYWAFKNAGWHFTWMGGRERIRQKMRSVVEGKDNTDHLTDEVVDQLIDRIPVVPLDARFPSYVLEHADELIQLGFISAE